jgi:anti-anti-sigma factor
MEIDLEKNEDQIKVTIDGNIDTQGGQILSETLYQIMEMKKVTYVVFDMTTVKTITSSGIGKLLNFFKHIDTNGGKMKINGISESLYTQFQEIHLDRIFPISK